MILARINETGEVGIVVGVFSNLVTVVTEAQAAGLAVPGEQQAAPRQAWVDILELAIGDEFRPVPRAQCTPVYELPAESDDEKAKGEETETAPDLPA